MMPVTGHLTLVFILKESVMISSKNFRRVSDTAVLILVQRFSPCQTFFNRLGYSRWQQYCRLLLANQIQVTH